MANNILGIDDHYLKYPEGEWGFTDLNNPEMINPWLEIQQIVNPKKVIEIGMFAGHSSLVMMNVFKNLESLVSYDPHPIAASNARQIKKFWPIHEFYNNPIWGDEDRHENIDLIFVDGAHHRDYPIQDLDSCFKIKPRYILVDNIEVLGVRRATKIAHNLWSLKYDPKYYFYTNVKYSERMKDKLKSPGIMGLFKMEGLYE